MNVFTLSGEIVLNGMESIQNQLNQLSNRLNQTSTSMNTVGKTTKTNMKDMQTSTVNATAKMSSSLTKLGGVLATVFSVRVIKNFVSQLTKVSAEVDAEMAQFNAVFTDFKNHTWDVTKEASEAIQRVSDETGVLATRMRSAGTSAFAMFRGAGMELNDSLSSMESYLTACADASAFYDKELSEVTGNMLAFIRGQTRAGMSIGLYTSELQRNEKAMELYGTTYQKLNQAQRESVMIDIIKQTYELAGVTGQANRESDQYVNTMGNLREAWRQFQAVIGKPLLSKMLPVVQAVTNKLNALTQSANKISEWWENNAEAVEEVKTKLIQIGLAIGGVVLAISALKIIKGIIPLVKGLISAFMGGGWFILLLAGISAIVVAFVNLYNTNEDFRNKVTVIWDAIKTKFNSVLDFIKEKWEAFKVWVAPIVENVKGLFSDLGELFTTLWNNILSPIWNLLTTAVKNAWDYISEHSELLREIINGIVDTFRSVVQMLTALFNGDFKGALNLLLDIIKKTFTNIYNAVKYVWGLIYSFFEPIVTAILDWFKNVGTNVLNWLKGVWESIKTWVSGVWTSITTWFSNLLTTIGDFASSVWEKLKAPFVSLAEYLKGFWDSIKTTFTSIATSIGDAISGGIKTAINGVFSFIEKTLNGAINLINKVIDGINWINFLDIGGDIKHIEPVSLPRLAKGGLVTAETALVAGEAGDEAIIPLTDSSALSDIASAIAEHLGGLFDFSSLGLSFNLSDAIASLWESIKSTTVFQEIAKALGFPIKEEIEEAKEGVEELSDTAEEANNSVWSKIKAGFNSAKDWLKNARTSMNSFFSKVKEKLDDVVGYLDSYITPLFDSIAELEDQRAEQHIEQLSKELEGIQKNNEEEEEADKQYYDNRLAELFNMLDVGQMSYEDYSEAVSALDNEVASNKEKRDAEAQAKEHQILVEKDNLARKQFEANKKTSIANVWINSAQAIVKALAELGVIAGGIASALILTTAGIQTKTISEQEYTPMLAEGGIIDKATHAIVGEDGAEAVVPLERNLGWVNKLSDVITPTIQSARVDYTPHIKTISDQLFELKQMLAEYLPVLGNKQIVMDGEVVAQTLTPYMNSTLGRASRLAVRGV